MEAPPVRFVRHRSGVRVLSFPAPGPLFSACIVVPTPAPPDNSGIPHCLEHLTFLGSRDYPERGYLDSLAIRCLSSGTNAWTADDHTSYTCVTAGPDGLLATLPVLLDHVLFPTLTDANFLHEVFHISEDGSPAGVVYNEMVGRENTEGDLLNQAWRAALFKGTSLENDAGGRTRAIAILDNDRVKKYHAEWYRHNAASVAVIVGGGEQADASFLDSVVAALSPILDRLPKSEPRLPLSLALQPLPDVQSFTVPFPTPEEDVGSVTLAWRGPAVSEVEELAALTVLLRYLAGTPASPLYQEFVECSHPKASDIERDVELFPVAALVFIFCGVPVRSAEEDDNDDRSEDESSLSASSRSHESSGTDENLLAERVLGDSVVSFLSDITSSADGSQLPGGIAAIQGAVDKERVRLLDSQENDVHEYVRTSLATEILYADQTSNDWDRLSRQWKALEKLRNESLSWWNALARKWLVENPRVEIRMAPSPVRAMEIEEDTKVFFQSYKQALGDDGLSELKKRAKQALEDVKLSRNGAGIRKYPSVDPRRIPRIAYGHGFVNPDYHPSFLCSHVTVESNFAHFALGYETSQIQESERELLPLLADLLLSMPHRLRDGVCVEYTDIVQQISDDCVAAGVSVGVGQCSREMVSIDFSCELHKVSAMCRNIAHCIVYSEVTHSRVKTVANNLLNTILEDSRDGESVNQSASVVVNEGYTREESSSKSTAYLLSLVNQRRVIRHVVEALDSGDKGDLILCRLRALKSKLFGESQGLLLVAGKSPETLRDEFLKVFDSCRNKDMQLAAIPETWEGHVPSRGLVPPSEPSGIIVEVVGVESSFVDIWVPCLVPKSHPDYFALEVTSELLSLTEGPIYNSVRGTGLAYDASVGNRIWSGQLCFALHESSAPAKAWEKFCSVLQSLEAELANTESPGPILSELETAKAGVLFSLHEGKASPAGVAQGVFRAFRQGLRCSETKDAEHEAVLAAISFEDVSRVFKRYFARFLKGSSRQVVATCGPSQSAAIVSGFEGSKLSFKCKRVTSLDDLADLQAGAEKSQVPIPTVGVL